MDVSLLREEYRSRRERQSRRTQVLLFTADSEQPLEAIGIVPVAQGVTSPGVTSPGVPNNTPTSPVTFDSDQKMYDPWHVHLDLHRRCRTAVCTRTSRWWWSSSEVGGSQQDTSHCGEGDPHPDCDGSSGGSSRTCGAAQVQSPSEQHLREDPPDGASRMTTESPVSGSEGPEAPSSDDGTHLHQDQNQEQNQNQNQEKNGSAESRADGSQNHYPFPSRRAPRISEAARRLGMYSAECPGARRGQRSEHESVPPE
ncbi:uncharacterized protein PAE49_022443 [Odontesthes bonariensis]|uniref:uncharacterized protein LOC142370206 n=1 Tax=Odontesthes bonariensis TaxID=219752 RepID=UPI003F583C77